MVGKIVLPIILQIVGVVVIIMEFILPSMGLLSIIAIALFGYSLYMVFSKVSVITGITFVAVDLVMIPLLIVLGIKMLAASPVTLRNTLSSKDGTLSQPPEWVQLVGVCGNAVTDLRPSGMALLNGKRYDVISRGEYIAKNSAVTVISVEGNRIVVKHTDIVTSIDN